MITRIGNKNLIRSRIYRDTMRVLHTIGGGSCVPSAKGCLSEHQRCFLTIHKCSRCARNKRIQQEEREHQANHGQDTITTNNHNGANLSEVHGQRSVHFLQGGFMIRGLLGQD